MNQAFELAVRSHRSGRHHDAEQLYKSMLQVQPDPAGANYNLGILKNDSGQPHEAIVFLKAALYADRGQSVFWISYVDALMGLGRIAEAAAVLNEAKSLGLAGGAVEQLEKKLRLLLPFLLLRMLQLLHQPHQKLQNLLTQKLLLTRLQLLNTKQK